MSTIQRVIRFYRFDIGQTEAFLENQFDPKPMLERISRLSANNRYMDSEDRRTTCVIDSLQTPYKIRLANIRITDFPSVEQGGIIKALDLPKNAGLFETIHIVFFPDNVIGFDSNFYGPRVSKLLDYFHERTTDICPKIIFLEPLINPKIAEQLSHIRSIKLFDLKMKPAYIDQISELHTSLSDALRTVNNLGDAEEIEILLKVNPRSKSNLDSGLLGTVKRLMRKPDLDLHLEKFIIKGFDDELMQNVELDLLNDKLVTKRQILKVDDRTKTLNPESAYNSIISSYEELEQRIKEATSIRI